MAITHEAATELLKALKLAETFVGKAYADGAFSDCAMRGDKALLRIRTAIELAEGTEQSKPRASVMPAHLEPLDHAFLSALEAPIPEEVMREKAGR